MGLMDEDPQVPETGYPRAFKGVWVPAELYLNQTLSWTEKLLIIEIDSLDQDIDKGCWKTNKELGDFLGVSETRVAHAVSDLKKSGWIKQLWFNGRRRGLCTKLRDMRLVENDKSALSQVTSLPGQKRQPDVSNTKSNTDIERDAHTGEGADKGDLRYGLDSKHMLSADLADRMDDTITWLRNKKRMRHLPPQEYEPLFAGLARYGIDLDMFREYYEWMEKQEWVRGTISPALLIRSASIEQFLRRDELNKPVQQKQAPSIDEAREASCVGCQRFKTTGTPCPFHHRKK